MIHVATVHHRDDRFVNLQLDALERWIDEPFETWAVLDNVTSNRFDHVVTTTETKHGPRLDAIARSIIKAANPSDLIMFIDGDAWPIANPMPTVHHLLRTNALVAVRRDEALAGPWPHPCFCVMPVRMWTMLGSTWEPRTWKDPTLPNNRDVGVGVLLRLEAGGHPWAPLLRLNTFNPHRLFFAIYGHEQPLVYHHGAGFRPMRCLTDKTAEQQHANEALSTKLIEHAAADPYFWRIFKEG